MKHLLLVCTCFLVTAPLWSQNGYPQLPDSLNPRIKIKGKVTDGQGHTKPDILVINDRIGAGTFGNPNGTFTVYAHKMDTLLVGAFGYLSEKVCFADSTIRDSYYVEVQLRPLALEIGAAEVFAPRDLDDIQKDISTLGFNESDYRTSGVDAFYSPITFLYEQFSRRERGRRMAIQLENNDRLRALLKELFAKYIDYDIIDLDPEEFDAFIDYLNVSDVFLKSSSQYDFIMYVKVRYQDYRVLYKQEQLTPGDYEYDQDATPPLPATPNRGN